jgi:hypothetical protein
MVRTATGFSSGTRRQLVIAGARIDRSAAQPTKANCRAPGLEREVIVGGVNQPRIDIAHIWIFAGGRTIDRIRRPDGVSALVHPWRRTAEAYVVGPNIIGVNLRSGGPAEESSTVLKRARLRKPPRRTRIINAVATRVIRRGRWRGIGNIVDDRVLMATGYIYLWLGRATVVWIKIIIIRGIVCNGRK